MKKVLLLVFVVAMALCTLNACASARHTHSFGEWEQVQAPTCTQAGTKARVCSTCNAKEEEPIPMQGHDWKTGKYNATHHYTECGTCHETKDASAHTGNPCTGCDYAYSEGLEYKLADGGAGYVLAGMGDCTDVDLVVPATYEGKPVVEVKAFAFQYSALTSVTLPSTVKTIWNAAFMHSSSLARVEIPEGVERIEGMAFSNCAALNDVVLPDSIRFIGGLVFEGTAHYADTAKWEDGALYMGKHLIKAQDLSGTYAIREGTITVATYALSANEDEKPNRITSLTVPASVVYIGRAAFGDLNELESFTVAADNAVYFSAGNCVIEKATGRLIAGCMKSEIPEDGSVTIIGSDAFRLEELEEITIPVAIVEIEEFAFNWCDKFWRIRYKGTTAQWNAVKKASGWKNSTASYFVVKCTDGDII